MMSIRYLLCRSAIVLLCWFAAALAHAVPVTVTYTGDNITEAFAVVNGVVDLQATGANSTSWTMPDSQTIDLHDGDYAIIFRVTNSACDCLNPAALLAEISGDGVHGDLLSGSTWDFAIAQGATFGSLAEFSVLDWFSAYSYGLNGGDNIWTTVAGGPIAGISQQAQWIWSGNNFLQDVDQAMDWDLYFRASISVLSTAEAKEVPEPGTLFLLATGLLCISLFRRSDLLSKT